MEVIGLYMTMNMDTVLVKVNEDGRAGREDADSRW